MSSPYNSEDDPDYELELEPIDEEDTDYAASYSDADEAAASDDDLVIEELGGGGEEDEDERQGSEPEEDESNPAEIGNGGEDEGPSEAGNPSGSGGVELDRLVTPNCPVCFEPWTPEGPHRVCCIPCGHLYGRSCLEKWAQRFGKNAGKCPLCNRTFNKRKEIINLFAPLIAVQNNELEKEVLILREKNQLLQHEKNDLLEQINKHKKRHIEREFSDGQKMTCLEHASSGVIQRKLFGHLDERWSSSSKTLFECSIPSQNYNQGGLRYCSLVLQNELVVEDARVMGIDASSHILLVAGKRYGVAGEHVLSKISLLAPNEIHKVMLPPNTGATKDLCILPNGLALLASLGKKLSLFSTRSNNLVLKYDLPVPAWSCSGDFMNQNHIYAGLQNGTLLMFDIRQTARYLDSMDGLSRHPIHTIHSFVHCGSTRNVVTASSLGPCIWDTGGNGERPFLIPEMENQGICIALSCSASTGDMVASFRPKVEVHNDAVPSQLSVSPSPPVSGSGKLGSHVLIKRVNPTSFQKDKVASGYVSEVRMSKSAIICYEDCNPLFAYGEESSHGVCLLDLPSFHMYTRLKPHRHPILDLKYARSTGPGFLGCVSENKLQVFTCL